MNRPHAVGVTLASLAILVLALAASPPPQTTSPVPQGAAEPALDKDKGEPPGWTTAVDPKPLSKNALAGLKWLLEHQHENGGWAQGEESSNMRAHKTAAHAQPNVGNTAAATLALIRSGSTPSEGPYAASIHMGVKFIMGKIEASGPSSLPV